MFIYVSVEDKKASKNAERTSYVMIILFSVGVSIVLLLGYIKLIKECLRPSVFKYEKRKKDLKEKNRFDELKKLETS